MADGLYIPSWAHGFARNAAESAAPDLWRGLVGAWVPALGPTGGTLHDVAGSARDGTLTNMDPATDWVVGSPGSVLDFDGSNDYVNVPIAGLPVVEPLTMIAVAMSHNITTMQTLISLGNNGPKGYFRIFFNGDKAGDLIV